MVGIYLRSFIYQLDWYANENPYHFLEYLGTLPFAKAVVTEEGKPVATVTFEIPVLEYDSWRFEKMIEDAWRFRRASRDSWMRQRDLLDLALRPEKYG